MHKTLIIFLFVILASCLPNTYTEYPHSNYIEYNIDPTGSQMSELGNFSKYEKNMEIKPIYNQNNVKPGQNMQIPNPAYQPQYAPNIPPLSAGDPQSNMQNNNYMKQESISQNKQTNNNQSTSGSNLKINNQGYIVSNRPKNNQQQLNYPLNNQANMNYQNHYNNTYNHQYPPNYQHQNQYREMPQTHINSKAAQSNFRQKLRSLPNNLIYKENDYFPEITKENNRKKAESQNINSMIMNDNIRKKFGLINSNFFTPKHFSSEVKSPYNKSPHHRFERKFFEENSKLEQKIRKDQLREERKQRFIPQI